MELNETKILITKYYDGETSLVEEQALGAFLASYTGDDAELQAAKAMFGAFSVMSNETISKPVAVKRPKVVVNLRRVMSYAAACVAVVFVAIVGIKQLAAEPEPMIVCHINGVLVDDQLVAQAEATKILSSVFSDVDNAMAEVNRITGYSNRR